MTANSASRLREAAAPLGCVTLFVLASAAGALGHGAAFTAPVVEPLRKFTLALAEAHYEMQQATLPVNASGRIELAMLPTRDSSQHSIESFVSSRSGWLVRNSAIDGWLVVEVPVQGGSSADAVAAGSAPLALLREQPFTRIALRNRGLWICH